MRVEKREKPAEAYPQSIPTLKVFRREIREKNREIERKLEHTGVTGVRPGEQ